MNLARIQPKQQILPIDLVAPGSFGLNTVEAGMLIDPKYATQALNAVIDVNGRLAARNGIVQVNGVQIANSAVQSLFEWKSGPATYNQIGVAAGTGPPSFHPFNSFTNETAVTAGTHTPNSARYYFQNFNSKLIGFQANNTPVVYTGGAWNNLVASSGVVPTSNGVGAAAFGRIFMVANDGQTINYSGLLDETNWGGADSGSIDMHTVWTDGTDVVTAIFQFNAALVVCGLKHIVFFTDGRGSLIGMDPTQAYVFDVVTGTGCFSQWTVDYVGQSDVLYLSPNGVQSLNRITQERSNPVQTLTKLVRDQLLAQLQNETSTGGVLNTVSGAFNPQTGFYLLTLPINKTVYCLDMRRAYMDDTGEKLARVTTWVTPLSIWSILTDHTSTTYFGMDASIVANYSGTGSAIQDVSGFNTTANYTLSWLSPWMNFAQQGGEGVAVRLKMLKQYNAVLSTANNAGIVFTWNTDFQATAASAIINASGQTSASQYGINQYGSNSVPLSQYGLGGSLLSASYPAHARGQYYQVGINATIGGPLSIQQIQLNCKIGRIAGPLVH